MASRLTNVISVTGLHQVLRTLLSAPQGREHVANRLERHEHI